MTIILKNESISVHIFIVSRYDLILILIWQFKSYITYSIDNDK